MQRKTANSLADRYAEYFGLCVAISVGGERHRCRAHIEAASLFGRPELALPYIENGEPIHPRHWEHYALEAARVECIESQRPPRTRAEMLSRCAKNKFSTL